MCEHPHHLLILACSQRKRTTPGLLPALDRYDGVNFRVLHKALREGYWPDGLRILIISAKFGLLEADQPVLNYNLRITRDIALGFQESISQRLDEVLRERAWKGVFINLGRDYLPAVAASSELTRLSKGVLYAEGGIGERMADRLPESWSIPKVRIPRDDEPEGGRL